MKKITGTKYKTEHHKSIWPWDDVIKLIKKLLI